MSQLLILLFLSLLGSCTTYDDRVEGRAASSSAGEFYVQTHVYSKSSGQKIMGDLFLPEKGNFHPLVIMIHGGGWTRGRREQMTPIAEKFVRKGVAVFNISYRLAPEFQWPAQREDIESALQFIVDRKKEFSIDTSRVAAFGYSAGAHLALMLAYHPDRDKPGGIKLRAVAGGGSPVDLTAWPKGELVVQFIGKPYDTHSHLYKDASPLSYVRKGLPPTFLYHGENDWIVEVEQSHKLLRALQRFNVEAEFNEPFFGHVSTFLFDDKETDMVLSFFLKHFKKKELLSVDWGLPR